MLDDTTAHTIAVRLGEELGEQLHKVDWTSPLLLLSALAILFNPLMWNVVSHLEHRTRFVSKLFGGNRYAGCYFMAATFSLLGVVRNLIYCAALLEQPTWYLLETPVVTLYAAYACCCLGVLLVLTSFYRLGVAGTYLGDYFGILMKGRVTQFPYNVSNHPMYQGSALIFLGLALSQASFVGLLLTTHAHIVYRIAELFEEPFTERVYKEAGKEAGKDD